MSIRALLIAVEDIVDAVSALTGITAAVVGVVLNLAVFFGKTVIWPKLSIPHSGFSVSGALALIAETTNVFGLVLAIAAFFALQRFKVSLSYVVLACAIAGLLKHLVSYTPLDLE